MTTLSKLLRNPSALILTSINLMKQFFLISFIIIPLACDSSSEELFEIDPRMFPEKNEIFLSDIADEIKYYPLDNRIPFENFKYFITQDNIYLSAKDIGILKFTRDGTLIRKIGSKGRGPGEFLFGMYFAVDERSGNIFVMDPGKVMVYSQSGRFIREILIDPLDENMGWNSDIEIFNSFVFIPNTLAFGESKLSWVLLDTLGNTISTKKNSVPPFKTNVENKCVIYKYNNKLAYFNYYNDTIFYISPDLSLSSNLLFAQGEHRWPKTFLESNSRSQLKSQIFKLFKPLGLIETKRFIVLSYSYLEKAAIVFIEKKSKKVSLAYNNISIPNGLVNTKACITNDFDGGLPISNPQYYLENDEEYISTLMNPNDLKQYVASSEFKNNTPKYPEQKKNLINLAENLKDTDNPVLVLVKLK